jgi:endonuclease/exonuclease/phosphatase family metal-dependent hydrolase
MDGAEPGRLRVLTLNLFAQHADWSARRAVLRAGLADLRPDVVALQEATVDEGYDSARDVLGDDYELAHQTVGLVGDGQHHGASVASRWPITGVHEVDLHLTARTGEYSCGAVIAEVAAPEPFGRLLVVSHGPSWAWWAEHERERQAVAVVRRIEELLAERPGHVIVGGDFNAEPQAASMRFWTGRQSLDGASTAYRDCWESVHGDEPGWTFDPANPLTATDEPGLDRGRRIDCLLVRCGDHGPTLAIDDCRRVLDAPANGVWPSDHYGVLAELACRPPLPGGAAGF